MFYLCAYWVHSCPARPPLSENYYQISMRCDPNWSLIKPRTSMGPLQIRPLTNEMACLTFLHYSASHCLSHFLLSYVTSPLLSPSLLLYSPPAWQLVAFQNNCTVILKLMPNCFTTHREKRPSQLLFCFHLTKTDIMLMILPTWAWKSFISATRCSQPPFFLWYENAPPPPLKFLHVIVNLCIRNQYISSELMLTNERLKH